MAGCTAATGEGQGHPVLERTRSAMAPGGGGVEGDEVEFVRGAGVKVELDGYAGLAQAQGVGEVFVAEHVELGDLDVGGRTPGRVGDARQRRAPAAPATTYTATRPGQARG